MFRFNVDFPSFPSQLFVALPRDKAKVLPSTGKLVSLSAVGTGLVQSCLELTWCLPSPPRGTNISPFQRHF